MIMILMPASEKVSWWGYADSSSSTIRTEGLQWKLAAEHVPINVDPNQKKKKQNKKQLLLITCLEQHCSGITCHVILQICASRQPIGQIQRGLLLTVKVPLHFTVKPKDNNYMRGSQSTGAEYFCFRRRCSLHDEDVERIHQNQDKRLPPAHKHQISTHGSDPVKRTERMEPSVHTSTHSHHR